MVSGEIVGKTLSDEELLLQPFGSVSLILRKRRRELGLSARDLAGISGLSVRTVYGNERGNRRPNLGAIAHHLQLSEEDLAQIAEQHELHRQMVGLYDNTRWQELSDRHYDLRKIRHAVLYLTGKMAMEKKRASSR